MHKHVLDVSENFKTNYLSEVWICLSVIFTAIVRYGHNRMHLFFLLEKMFLNFF